MVVGQLSNQLSMRQCHLLHFSEGLYMSAPGMSSMTGTSGIWLEPLELQLLWTSRCCRWFHRIALLLLTFQPTTKLYMYTLAKSFSTNLNKGHSLANTSFKGMECWFPIFSMHVLAGCNIKGDKLLSPCMPIM